MQLIKKSMTCRFRLSHHSVTLACALGIAFSLGSLSSTARAGCLQDNLGKALSVLSKPIVSRSKQELKAAKAQELAALIAVDPETQKIVSDPEIAQYVYLNYFAEKVGQNEIKVALQDIADSVEANTHDLYDLISVKLAERLKNPEVQAKVKEAFAGNDAALRPSSLSAKLYDTKARLKQALLLPQTLARMKKQTDIGFSRETMDRGLFDLYGSLQLGLPESESRPWEHIPGGHTKIRPNQVQGISPQLWAKIVQLAAEIELPIHDYSLNSGDQLRGLLPTLSRFTGKTLEQEKAFAEKMAAATDVQKQKQYCVATWCTEEQRHDGALRAVAERILGRAKDTPPTYSAPDLGDFSNSDFALYHLLSRNTGEWNANSGYNMLLTHARGEAAAWLTNVRRDETKHLAIFAGAWKYVYGSQYGKRTREMIKKVKNFKDETQESNSSGDAVSLADFPVIFETGASYAMIERKVREYLRGVPLKTMEKIFDSPMDAVAQIDSVPVLPEKQKLIDEMRARERASRARLERWEPAEREEYLKLKQVEKEDGPLIESLIVNMYDGFTGAEVTGSPAEKAILDRIARLKTGYSEEKNALIQKSLRETLRDYQIMNNETVRKKPELIVRFKNAQEGFIVEHRAPDQSKVLMSQALGDSTHLIRVEKPPGMDLKPGQAIRVSLDTEKGKQARILSLASSPNQDYLEFAVRTSDSDFKRAFTSLKPGKGVRVELAKGTMDFKTDVPAVMIAGGIGITPFRSMIQFAQDQKLKTPIKLIYANHDQQIAFEKELNAASAAKSNLDVEHVVSHPNESWTGTRGRVDESYLKKNVPDFDPTAQYYIVGPPAMVTSVKDTLQKQGIPEQRISIEIFAGSGSERSVAKSAKNAEREAETTNACSAGENHICVCQSVPENVIRLAIEKGAKTPEQIRSQTNAGTACGRCMPEIMSMVCEAKGI